MKYSCEARQIGGGAGGEALVGPPPPPAADADRGRDVEEPAAASFDSGCEGGLSVESMEA